MTLFGGSRREEAPEAQPCPAWARDYLLAGSVPAKATPEGRELRRAVYGGKREDGAYQLFVGIARVWRTHRAALLAEWKHRGGKGKPPGSRFDREETYPDVEEIDEDPRGLLARPDPAR